MAVNRQETIRQAYKEMHGLLPDVFSDTTPVSGSTFNSFVYSLSNEFGEQEADLHDFRDNQNSLTATTGIEDWEDLVNLPRRPDLNIETRRARVFSRISGTPCTVETIKNVVKSYVGSDDFEIFEYHTLNDPASAFRYKVSISRPPTTDYDEESLQEDLIRIQPAHCGDFVEIEDRWDQISDTFTFTDSVSSSVVDFFVIGSSTIGGTDVIE